MSDPGRDHLEVPAPTAAPLVAAFGLTLLAAGLVTHLSVSVVGLLLALAGAVGWWREVLPTPHEEVVPLPPIEEREAALVPPAAVRLPTPGEEGHRVRLPVVVQPYSAGAIGGMVGAVAMAAVACGYGLLAQGSVWYPINLLAAAALPGLAEASTEQLRAFDGRALLVATLTHGAISVPVGLLYAAILPMLPRRHMLWGGLVAPLLWTGVVSALLGIVNPVLHARIDWSWFIASQLAFGLVVGWVVSRAPPVETMQTWPLLARAGLRRPPSDAGRTP